MLFNTIYYIGKFYVLNKNLHVNRELCSCVKEPNEIAESQGISYYCSKLFHCITD